MADVKKALGLVSLINKLSGVDRVIRMPGRSEVFENDVEHSYGLAMLAWYIVDIEGLDLDKEKVLKYALIHDLVEVYAGDVAALGRTEEQQAAKVAAEAEAMERIRSEFSEFSELGDLMEAYINKVDRESRFVFAIDKVQPIMMIYLDDGRMWKERGETLSMIRRYVESKVSIDPVVHEYYKQLIDLIETNEEKFFGQ